MPDGHLLSVQPGKAVAVTDPDIIPAANNSSDQGIGEVLDIVKTDESSLTDIIHVEPFGCSDPRIAIIVYIKGVEIIII